MINFYDKNRSISKSTLTKLAEVSPSTFRRYLATRRHILDAMGVKHNAHNLPPQAVEYILYRPSARTSRPGSVKKEPFI